MTPPTDDSQTPSVRLRAAIDEATREPQDEDAYRAAIAALGAAAPTDELWALMSPLATSHDERIRALVVDTLVSGDMTHRTALATRALGLFEKMLVGERSIDVLSSIGYAIHHLHTQDGFALMLPFVGHAEAEVRLAAAVAMAGIEDPRAIAALVTLSNDPESEIRDWATFNLGSQLGDPDTGDLVDTPELRDVLAARLADPYADARAEAVVGLAARKDARALPFIRSDLEGDSFGMLYVDAARYLADPSLAGVLRRVLDEATASDAFSDHERLRIRAALDACTRRPS